MNWRNSLDNPITVKLPANVAKITNVVRRVFKFLRLHCRGDYDFYISFNEEIIA